MVEHDQSIRHIVLFKLYDEVAQATLDEAIAILQGLGQDDETILEWSVGQSLNTSKGKIIVENGLFTDASALENFRTSEKHQRAAAFMTKIADWWVGDLLE